MRNNNRNPLITILAHIATTATLGGFFITALVVTNQVEEYLFDESVDVISEFATISPPATIAMDKAYDPIKDAYESGISTGITLFNNGVKRIKQSLLGDKHDIETDDSPIDLEAGNLDPDDNDEGPSMSV